MRNKFFKLALSAVLSVSCLAAGFSGASGLDGNANNISKDGYTIAKVSHPDRGSGQSDGILPFEVMGEESNRNQSYIWSSVEYGNYIYLGTCWNPISGIYYRNLKNNLTSLFEKRGDKNPGQKAGTVATNILNVMYDGNFPDGATSTKGTPCIMRVNKYTYETELVYVEKESSAFVNWNGYRMAIEYKGKLYFACAGYPTSRLLQIDPKTKATKVVMQKTAENSAFSNGIRGLTVMNGKLLVSLATDGADPDHMFENGSQLPQAYQNAIKAIAKKDVRYKDDNPRMQGARLLETDDPENVDSWKVIANQETFDNLPACWIRDSINGGGLWDLAEFNGSLYVSMVTGKTDATTGVTHKQGFAVYRGDPQKDGSWKWTPIIGDTSKGAKYEFGLGKKQSCAGNLYTYKDHLYIGGYNDPMLDLAEIGNKADFHLLYEDLKNPACLNRMDKNGNIELINDDGFGAASTQYLWRFSEYNNKLVIGTFDITTLAKGFTQLTDGSLSEMTPEEFKKKMDYVEDLLESLKKDPSGVAVASEDESVDEMMDQLEDMKDIVEGDNRSREVDQDIVEVYDELIENYKKFVKPLLHEINPELEKQIDDIILNSTVENFVYYYGCSQIVSKQEAGCDVLVSSDGVHFDALTRNGFNDKYNHGGRAFIPTDNGLFIGMANPFWGTQLWRITDGSENPIPDTDKTDKPDTDKTNKPDTDKTDKPEIKEDQPFDKGNTTIKPTETKKEDKKKVNTGDHTQVMIYVAAIIISSLAVVLLKRKKAEN